MSGREWLLIEAKRHVKSAPVYGSFCYHCHEAWPCPASRLFAALEEALGQIRAVYQQWHACQLTREQAKAMKLETGILCDNCEDGIAYATGLALAKLSDRSLGRQKTESSVEGK